MPSTMIHLMTAHEIEPDGPAYFWVGSFAPDYTNDRALKDSIHLRDAADRWASLASLYKDIDKANAFERGWFLHLFTDACWDEAQLMAYKDWFVSANGTEQWFMGYREEIGLATYYLYHHLPWAQAVWAMVERALLDEIVTTLPIAQAENAWYRDRVLGKHRESDPAQTPKFFTMDKLTVFALTTARRYKEWALAHTA